MNGFGQAPAARGVKIYRVAELAAMSPDQLASVHREVTQAATAMNDRLIQLKTQQEGLQAQLDEARAAAEREFGVSTPEGLAALKDAELARLGEVYGELERALMGKGD